MTRLTKIVYIILFASLLFHPHVISGHIFSIPRAFAQSFTTLVILGLAYITYLLNQREIKLREQQTASVEKDLEISGKKLTDSYKYLGQVNRRLPLLKNLTTDLLKREPISKNGKKNIFNELLATAVVSIARADWGIFRFTDNASGKTVKEFPTSNKIPAMPGTKVSNKELLTYQELKKTEEFYIIPSSDQTTSIKCFLIFPQVKESLDGELSVLQSIVDQAHLFYKYLY